MVQCNVACNYVDEYYKSVIENGSSYDRYVARLLVWDILLALLYDDPFNCTVFSILVCLRASGVRQPDQTDGRSGHYSGFQPDVYENDQSLV